MGDVEKRMKPLASSSSMYDFIVCSGCDSGKTLPLGGWDPRRRSMAQSLARWGGKCDALTLLKPRLDLDIRWVMGLSRKSHSPSWRACCGDNLKAEVWPLNDLFLVHEIEGLCCSSHGRPRMMGFVEIGTQTGRWFQCGGIRYSIGYFSGEFNATGAQGSTI